MEKILRYFNQNTAKIIKVVLIVIFVILIIQSLNKMYQDNVDNEVENTINTTVSEKKIKYTVTDSKKIKEDDVELIKTTLDTFISCCNNKEIDKAYECLTDECKNALYSSVENFNENYIKSNFNTYKKISMQAWSADERRITYIIRFSEDMLSSGKVGNIIEEYYTFIKQEDGRYKININNYIYGEQINKEVKSDGLTVKINYKDVYKDYEQYNFELINTTENVIFLEDYVSNIKLKDNDSIIYSIINEKTINKDILLDPEGKRFFDIEFNKIYRTQNQAERIIFKEMILDYEKNTEKKDVKFEI